MKAQQFPGRMAETANALDLDAHMNLVSKDVSVFSVPGFDVIGYDDWFNQCKHEFENKLLKQVSYEGLNVLAETPDKIMVLITGNRRSCRRYSQFKRDRIHYPERRRWRSACQSGAGAAG